ncbi:SDR family oxidoreductase, partial [Candidatus Sumerlaeota bacterium]|nr:SDR family oxidoreductase [Candidatus Sumerlaeota bacterium]
MNGKGGETILITGASSGIGRMCAEHLAARGWRVFGASRSGRDAQGIRTVQMDIDSDESVARGVESILGDTGRIDAAVNCAGSGLAGALEDTAIEEAKALFETNFFGALRVCRAVLPAMRAQRAGRIVNVGSIGGVISIPYEGIYSATKAALAAMTESLRMEMKPFGIHASVIEPGDFKTGFTAARKKAARAAEQDSPHRERFERVLRTTERREQTSPEPRAIA